MGRVHTARHILAAVFAAALIGGANAEAAADDTTALSGRLAHQLMALFDYRSLEPIFSDAIHKGMEDSGEGQPKCRLLLEQAFDAELVGGEPNFEASLEATLPSYFTIDEMRVGVRLFDGAPGELLRAAKSEPPEQLVKRIGPSAMQAAEKELATPEAHHFEDKLEDLGALGSATAHEFFRRIRPAALARFKQLALAAGLQCQATE